MDAQVLFTEGEQFILWGFVHHFFQQFVSSRQIWMRQQCTAAGKQQQQQKNMAFSHFPLCLSKRLLNFYWFIYFLIGMLSHCEGKINTCISYWFIRKQFKCLQLKGDWFYNHSSVLQISNLRSRNLISPDNPKLLGGRGGGLFLWCITANTCIHETSRGIRLGVVVIQFQGARERKIAPVRRSGK